MHPNSRGRHAGKSVYGYACLSPQLSEVLHATCRLANSNSNAMLFLSRSIMSMYDKVCEICRDSGFVPGDVQDVLKDIAGINSITPLNPSPQQKERVGFLERFCDESNIPEDPLPMSVWGREVYDEDVRMVDAIELNRGIEQRLTPVDAIVDLKNADELGIRFSGDHKKELGVKLGLSIRDERTPSNPHALFCELPGDIVGDQIEVYSVPDQEWRSAIVSCKLPDGRHVLIFFDGIVERVMLRERLWRPGA
ncbi:hypothetical protein FGB62_44g119 [Gracilaria domingensis]|nr:hypothetical protein FGB62_44g119 [Gracilaria domingensis]